MGLSPSPLSFHPEGHRPDFRLWGPVEEGGPLFGLLALGLGPGVVGRDHQHRPPLIGKRVVVNPFPQTEAERLAELEARKKALEAQMDAIQARQKERDRKADTRRKVLAGAAILAEAERDPAAKQRLMALLDRHLVRDVDRAVFDLAPKAKAEPTKVP